MRLASHLGLPLQEIQAKTTSSEFSKWMVYLQQEETSRVDKFDYYLAAIIAEVRRSWVSDECREQVHNKDFIINLTSTKEIKKKKKVETEEEKQKRQQDYLKRSKSHWLHFANIKEK